MGPIDVGDRLSDFLNALHVHTWAPKMQGLKYKAPHQYDISKKDFAYLYKNKHAENPPILLACSLKPKTFLIQFIFWLRIYVVLQYLKDIVIP